MGNDKGEEEKGMTEYEKQRLSRMRENKARLEALGLPALVSSVFSKEDQVKKRDKKKKKDEDEEEEYQPSDEDDDDEEEEEDAMENSSSEEKMPSSSSSRRKGKSSISSNELKISKVSHLKRGRKDDDIINDDDDDDDAALAQAIALSLGESVENKNGGAKIQNKGDEIRKSNTTTKEFKRTNKKLSKSRIQLSEDEVIGFFFSFDEVGKGYITAYDIEKMAIAHDFTWTDGEIAKMVRCFDSDEDRKLNLEDFRCIVSKCHMLQESE